MEKGKLFRICVQRHLQPPPQSLSLEQVSVPAQVSLSGPPWVNRPPAP
jgi:hypothetical protein